VVVKLQQAYIMKSLTLLSLGGHSTKRCEIFQCFVGLFIYFIFHVKGKGLGNQLAQATSRLHTPVSTFIPSSLLPGEKKLIFV